MMRRLLATLLSRIVLLSVVFSLTIVFQASAQCSSGTATAFNVNLSAAADTSFSVQSTRNGNVCSGTNCVIFTITVNPGANYVNFSVINPSPSGSAYYQINCGPQTSIGVPVCISGMTTFCISYCKPGNDNPTYKITTSTGVTRPADVTVRAGCSAGLTIGGLQTATLNWTSVFPGAVGAYNSYLSCITACSTTTVTPQTGAPPYIDYKVSGSNICGITISDTVRVYTVPALSVVITPANPTICGSNTVTLTAVATGGGAPYTYLWNTGQTTSSITVNTTGTYTVNVSDTSNCSAASASVNVTAGPIPAAPTAGNNGPLCLGSTLNLTATSIAGATYSWTGPNGFTSNVQNPSISNVSLAAAGTYTVTAALNGCTSLAATTTVIVNPIPSIPTAGNNGALCVGSTLNLTATTVTGATYNWTGPNAFTSTSQNPSLANVSLLNAGTYNVTATVNGCTSLAGTTTVVVNPIPSSPTAASNGPLCTGSTLILSATTVTGATYSWTGPNGFTSNIQNPSVVNVSLLNAGTYSVTAKTNGCTSPPGTTTVIVNSIPPAPVAASNSPICAGITLNLMATAVTGATYSWSGPNGFTSSLQAPAIFNTSLLNAGTYNVTATLNGCTSNASYLTVTINFPPSLPVLNSNSPVCAGSNLNLTANTDPGVIYDWVGPNGFTSNLQNPSINNAGLAATGAYSMTASINGCTTTPTGINVLINPLPPAPSAGSNGPLCAGSTLNLTASAVAGATYNWTGPNGFTSNVQNPSIANVGLSNAGTYSVTATLNGCTSPAGTTTVVITPIPAAPSANNNGPLCVGSILNLTASSLTGGRTSATTTTYNWTGPNGFTSSTKDPFINNVSLSDAGTYSVTVTVDGCTSLPTITTVVVNPVPAAPNAGNNGPLCAGSTLNLTAIAVAGATYNWAGPNGFTSNSQNPSVSNAGLLNAGAYNVTVTANGCTSLPSSTAVVINPVPPAPTAGNNGALCVGSTLNLTATTIAGATYNWSGPGGYISSQQNPVINNTTLANAGTYSVSATVNGCTSSISATAVVINPIPAAPTAGNNGPLCGGTILNLTATTVTGATYSWSGPNNFTSNIQNPSLNNVGLLHAGNYTVTATVNGCMSAPVITTVVINSTPAAPTPTSNAPLCSGSTLSFNTPAITGAVYNWAGPNGFASNIQSPVINTVSSLNAGTYSVTATVNGCTSPAGTIMVAVDLPSLSNAGNDQTICSDNSNVILSGSVTGGSATGIWTTNGTGVFSSPNNFTTNYLLSTADRAVGSVRLTLTSTNNGACAASTSSVQIFIKPTIVVDAGIDKQICIDQKFISLSGNITTGFGVVWTSSGTGLFSPSNTALNASYELTDKDKADKNITLTLTSTGGNCNPVSDDVSIIINPLPSVNAGTDETIFEGQTITLKPVVSGTIITYLWTPDLYLDNNSLKNVSVTGKNDQLYKLTVTDAFGCTNEDELLIKILKPFIIPNTFTPNNDGVNDTWIIKELEKYLEARVQVFNRYGQLVFESKGYTKPWDGTYNGKSLPFGTYYYIIEPGNGLKGLTGYVTIIK